MENNFIIKLKQIDLLIIQIMFKLNNENMPQKPPSRTQTEILGMIIDSKETLTQKDIESKLNVSRATISETLSKMEKYGLIKRVVSENDSRVKKIKLTEKSIEMHKSMNKIIQILNGKVNSILNENEKKDLNKLLEKLIIGLENESKNIGGKNV